MGTLRLALSGRSVRDAQPRGPVSTSLRRVRLDRVRALAPERALQRIRRKSQKELAHQNGFLTRELR